MKKTVFYVIVVVYIVLSSVYIIYTMWQNFKTKYATAAYEQGRSATVSQLIQQAEDETCQPFTVYNEDKNVQLINVACLQQAEAVSEETAE